MAIQKKWFGNSFADLCVYIIVVSSKWDGLLRHEFVTTTKKFLGGGGGGGGGE